MKAKHNHKVVIKVIKGQGVTIVLEPDCPRCQEIEKLLAKTKKGKK